MRNRHRDRILFGFVGLALLCTVGVVLFIVYMLFKERPEIIPVVLGAGVASYIVGYLLERWVYG